MGKIDSWFLHIDLDAFFASVEQLDHPEYRGKPVIVGGKPEDKRSVVSTASYEARKFGIHSAMPTSMAYNLCPQGIFVHGRMERYENISYHIMQIIKNYSPDFIQMSIDEAFIDITGTEKLFGSPIQTAQKIKDEIKEKTGLTVSIGIAPTKYLAKIASDINKPNGLYCVEQGKELPFMLNLPLKKIFGLGKKTLENLNKSGIFTTKEIYEKPLESLQFLCGTNTGSFLYKAVRGTIQDNFEKKSKSHSISSETTFPEDLTNIYTIETMLLDLCHSVIFRLLRENGYSKTIMIKIRYEDFSTVSIQQTYDRNILTLDSLYSKAKILFENKWEKNRGIRLIGICLENIEKEDKPYQQELFDDGSEKKQKVEKAILNLEKKHPEIKIHKARMLEKLNNNYKIILLVLFFSFIKNTKINAIENHSIQKGAAGILPETVEKIEDKEESTKLFDWELKGYWKGTFENGFFMTFANNTPFETSFKNPVFKQEIDLSAIFSINKKWKLQMEFMDNYNKNTFSLNYNGNSYLKEFTFSNRNIIFPDYYSVKNFNYFPGGGNNQAPGVYLHFEDIKNNKYQADLLFRYDMTQSKNATFYGKNSVTDTILNLEDFTYGHIFVIPDDQSLSQIKDVYVENLNGEYIDTNGKKYIKLSKSNYIISITEKTLTLSRQSKSEKNKNIIPSVLVTFLNESQVQSLINNIGDYENENSYLGKIQSYFSSNNNYIKLKDYSYKLTTKIENSNAVILQSPYGFSPFLNCANYDLGLLKDANVDVIYNNSDKVSQDYGVKNTQLDNTFVQTDFFSENRIYVEITNYLNENEYDYTLPQTRYPFADKNPFIYLTKESKSAEKLRVRSLSKVSNYDIGKNASEGSVKLYVNGIEDKGAVYSSTSGFVIPSINISDIDKVYITWDDEADSFTNGAFTGGIGFLYNLNESTKLDITLTTRIPFSPFIKYATQDNQFTNYTALTTGINYQKNNIKFNNSLTLAIENENTKNAFIVNQINSNKQQVYYLSQKAGYKTNCIPFLNTENSAELNQINCGTVINFNGIREENTNGYIIPLEWNFNNSTNGDNAWASVDISLTNNTPLCDSSTFEIALKNEQPLTDENYELYLQLGIKADEKYYGEDAKEIPTWKISEKNTLIADKTGIIFPFYFNNTDWQFIKISISESQRAKLISYKDARLIIVKKNFNISDNENTGKLFIGPFEPNNKNSIIKANKDIFITNTTEQTNMSNAAKKYFENEYYADKISWQINENTLHDDDLIIESSKYFKETNFGHYKNLYFDFSYELLSKTSTYSTSSNGLELILCQAADSNSPSLKLSISAACLKEYLSLYENFHTVRVDLENGNVYIDENLLKSSMYTLYFDKTKTINQQIIKINTGIESELITQGTFLTGSIYLTDIDYNFTAKNYIDFKYKNDSIILGSEKNGILKNPDISLISNQVLSKYGNSISSELKAKAESYNIEYNLDTKLNYNSNSNISDIFSNGGHSIITKSPIFNIISFSEIFRFSKDTQIDTSNNFTLDLNQKNIPIKYVLNIKGQNLQNQDNQSLDSTFNFKIPLNTITIESNTIFTGSQKSKIRNSKDINNLNYFTALKTSKITEFSNTINSTSERNTNLKTSLDINFQNIQFTPQLSMEFQNKYKNINQIKNETNYILNVKIPFTINNNTFSFNSSKITGNTQKGIQINNYFDDLNLIFSNLSDNPIVLSELPIYDLFDKNLSSKLYNNSITSFYSTKYELTWKHNLYNDIKDFFIPKTISAGITRDLRKTETINDIYQLKFTQINSFVNLFGKEGKIKKFDFFNQDEFSSSFTTSIKLPLGTTDITEYLVSYYFNYLMYINQENTIKTGLDFTISNTNNWKLRSTILWNHDGKYCILMYLPKLIFKQENIFESKILRREIINFSLGNILTEFSSSYEFSHYTEVVVNKNYSFYTTFGMIYKQFETKANSIDFNFELGAKLVF